MMKKKCRADACSSRKTKKQNCWFIENVAGTGTHDMIGMIGTPASHCPKSPVGLGRSGWEGGREGMGWKKHPLLSPQLPPSLRGHPKAQSHWGRQEWFSSKTAAATARHTWGRWAQRWVYGGSGSSCAGEHRSGLVSPLLPSQQGGLPEARSTTDWRQIWPLSPSPSSPTPLESAAVGSTREGKARSDQLANLHPYEPEKIHIKEQLCNHCKSR